MISRIDIPILRFWLTFAACFSLLAGHASAQASLKTAPSQKIAFQKVLPQKQTLIVLEKEIPYVPPPEVNLEPNAHFGVPDHVYLYTFELRTGQKTKILWSPIKNYYSGNSFSAEPAMKVLDAIISEGKLCVVYKQIGMTEANVITPGAPLNKPGIRWGNSVLILDSDARPILITSGTLSGSLEKSDLAVDLINCDSKHFRYRLVNDKWVKENPVSLPTDANTHPTPMLK